MYRAINGKAEEVFNKYLNCNDSNKDCENCLLSSFIVFDGEYHTSCGVITNMLLELILGDCNTYKERNKYV